MNELQFFVHNDADDLRVELAGSLGGADVEERFIKPGRGWH